MGVGVGAVEPSPAHPQAVHSLQTLRHRVENGGGPPGRLLVGDGDVGADEALAGKIAEEAVRLLRGTAMRS